MVFDEPSLPVLTSAHDPFVKFSLPCPAMKRNERESCFGGCLAPSQDQPTKPFQEKREE